MHVCKNSWSGQAFALATGNDSGGKKSRNRLSKEERKSMAESFIKKYQNSNDGNFPSLNLTHKEVGGSFYTVREIVREIIQENRVLAPPKVSLEENGHSEFLEQHPLGSISVEPEIDLSESERVMVAHIVHDKYQISSEENISTSNGSYPLELDNGQIINGVSKVAEIHKEADTTSESHHAPNHYQDSSTGEVSNSSKKSPLTKGHELEDEKIVDGSEVLDGIPHSDNSLVKNSDHLENIDGALLSSEKINGLGTQSFSDEQDHSENDQLVDKTEEFEQKVHTEPAVMETLDTEKFGAQKIETSKAMKSPSNSNVVVETFPLRPVPKTISNMDGESGKLQKTAGTWEDQAIQHEEKTYTQSSSGFVIKKGEEKLPGLNVKLNGQNRDEKVVLNLQVPSLENAKHPSTSEPSVLVKEIESTVSLPGATKASSSTETLISEEVGGKSSDQDNSSSSKGDNRTLDRINLDTWEGASKKSTRPESNPFLALVKAFISSFVKFWTE